MLKRVWAKKGSRPRRLVTGSKRKTCVYGTVSNDRRQVYRQYPTCNSIYFIHYVKALLAKFDKLILFADRAPWHTSKMTAAFFKEQRHRLKIIWFPPGFPESNPVEESWRQGKYDDNLGAKFHTSYEQFIHAVSHYYRTKRFKLDLLRYLCL